VSSSDHLPGAGGQGAASVGPVEPGRGAHRLVGGPAALAAMEEPEVAPVVAQVEIALEAQRVAVDGRRVGIGARGPAQTHPPGSPQHAGRAQVGGGALLVVALLQGRGRPVLDVAADEAQVEQGGAAPGIEAQLAAALGVVAGTVVLAAGVVLASVPGEVGAQTILTVAGAPAIGRVQEFAIELGAGRQLAPQPPLVAGGAPRLTFQLGRQVELGHALGGVVHGEIVGMPVAVHAGGDLGLPAVAVAAGLGPGRTADGEQHDGGGGHRGHRAP
jgi:hypothetical protein